MKRYLNMIVFIVILGIVASGILVGMELLTADRIEANEEIDLQKAILDGFGISYEQGSVLDIFESQVDMLTVDDLHLYKDIESGNYAYQYEGSGLWGPIIGVITLDENFDTIVSISVLQQEETPGLGGVVADPEYLSQYGGIKMIPMIEINKDESPNKENEVDTITGATRTSKEFEKLLNQQYTLFRAAYDSLN